MQNVSLYSFYKLNISMTQYNTLGYHSIGIISKDIIFHPEILS